MTTTSRADQQPFLIRVISIATSARRVAFTERAKTSLEWAFQDASTTNTSGLPYEDKWAITVCARPLLRTEVGCFSSHFGLWRQCADSDRPMIVLEDDVDVDWRFLEEMSARYAEYAGYEYLRFATTFKADRVPVGKVLDREVEELLGNPLGMQGYLMRPSHARRLVRRIRRIERPIDDEIDRAWRYGAPNLALSPPLVTDRNEPSEIANEENDIRKVLKLSIPSVLHKIWNKIPRDLYAARRLAMHRMHNRRVTRRA